jgi:uncharacterized membrane protein
MNGKLFRAILAGLFVAGLVHVIAVLLMPYVAENDADTRVRDLIGGSGLQPIPADASVLVDLDPNFIHAACSLDVSNGAYVIRGEMPTDIWSLAVVSKADGIVASIDNSSTDSGRIEVIAGLGPDVERIRLARANQASATAYAAMPSEFGFVLLRSYVTDAAERLSIREAYSDMSCAAFRQEACAPVTSGEPAHQMGPVPPAAATVTAMTLSGGAPSQRMPARWS